MRLLGHLVQMLPGHLPRVILRAHPTQDMLSLGWAGNTWIPPEELDDVAEEREVLASLLRLLPPLANS